MRRSIILMTCAAGLAFPAQARADGGPVAPQWAGAGVTAPGLPERYVTVGARGGTVVERTSRSGFVWDARWLPGRYGVSAVAFDGSSTGLAADGRTLILAGIVRRYPVRRTRFEVLDARALRPRKRISLPGWYTLDAVSPDGRTLYLIHYTSPRNTLRYEVRAYDVHARRLLHRPVVDPREPDEAMRGQPVTRLIGDDGRWAYTLYARPRGAPFVHALDTQGRTAACIDLPRLADRDPYSVRLRWADGGNAIAVAGAQGTEALVDARTFAVTRPAAGPRRPSRAGTGGVSAWWAALPLGGAAAAAALLLRRRRYARSASFRNAS